MFAKIFTQILDSSLADNYQTRHVFEDLLKLCDVNGVVDITLEAIARRTNAPLEIITQAIAELEKPDPRSRNPENDGRRIVRLDAHREWGWLIVNYDYYRKIASEEQRREKTLARVQKFRAKTVTQCNARNAAVTPTNAGNAMQMEMDKKNNKASTPTKSKKFSKQQTELVIRIEAALGIEWENDRSKWLKRIKNEYAKAEHVIAEVDSAIKENRIQKTPARYAEQIWKEFK
jgi:hypothetical protein